MTERVQLTETGRRVFLSDDSPLPVCFQHRPSFLPTKARTGALGFIYAIGSIRIGGQIHQNRTELTETGRRVSPDVCFQHRLGFLPTKARTGALGCNPLVLAPSLAAPPLVRFPVSLALGSKS